MLYKFMVEKILILQEAPPPLKKQTNIWTFLDT